MAKRDIRKYGICGQCGVILDVLTVKYVSGKVFNGWCKTCYNKEYLLGLKKISLRDKANNSIMLFKKKHKVNEIKLYVYLRNKELDILRFAVLNVCNKKVITGLDLDFLEQENTGEKYYYYYVNRFNGDVIHRHSLVEYFLINHYPFTVALFSAYIEKCVNGKKNLTHEQICEMLDIESLDSLFKKNYT